MASRIGTIRAEAVCFVAEVFDVSLKKINRSFESLSLESHKVSKMLILNPISIHDDFIHGCLDKIKLKVFLPNNLEIPKLSEVKEVSMSRFKKYCRSSLRGLLESYSGNFGINILMHRFKIEDVDIQKQGLTKDQGRLLAADFDCLYYALYILGESKFEDWVFGRTDKHPLKKGLSTLENKLNYRILSKSEVPQKGDLIFYIKDSGRVQHVGIFADSKMVNSKWGALPQIFSHPIFHCPYNDKYKIYRKK